MPIKRGSDIKSLSDRKLLLGARYLGRGTVEEGERVGGFRLGEGGEAVPTGEMLAFGRALFVAANS
jgi:hypothetical protein